MSRVGDAIRGEIGLEFSRRRNRREEEMLSVPDICRRKLLGYAETFEELARNFESAYPAPSVVLSESGVMETEERRRLLEERRLWENKQVIGSNLSEVAQIMTQIAQQVFRYQPMEERNRRSITAELWAGGIAADKLCYIPGPRGRKSVSMELWTDVKGGISAEQAADLVSVLLHRQLRVSVNSPCLIDEIERSFLFVEEPSILALTGCARAVKEGEQVSGDNYSVLESEQGKLILLLSDGTGSGEQASECSGKVLDLMEKLLEAGYPPETAVNLVNSVIFAGGEEHNHPTLDLCCLDLYQGGCDFCKVGGASSYVKRGEAVEEITAGTLPLGIFQSIKPQLLHRRLGDGDYLILMTDGVLDALEGTGGISGNAFGPKERGRKEDGADRPEEDRSSRVETLLSRMESGNPSDIAKQLLQEAVVASAGHLRDDCTVFVVGLWENV